MKWRLWYGVLQGRRGRWWNHGVCLWNGWKQKRFGGEEEEENGGGGGDRSRRRMKRRSGLRWRGQEGRQCRNSLAGLTLIRTRDPFSNDRSWWTLSNLYLLTALVLEREREKGWEWRRWGYIVIIDLRGRGGRGTCREWPIQWEREREREKESIKE